jgi:isocitrate dehydrogenase (NAD+)
MRNELDLFVNVLHCYSRPGVKTRHDNIDLVLVRQNTEGEYAMLEHQNVPGVIESLKIVTRENTQRLVTYAFEYARTHGRKKVTLVHKAVSALKKFMLTLKRAVKPLSEHYEVDRRAVLASGH